MNSISDKVNIMDTIENIITTELKNKHLMGDVVITTSPNSLYIKPKKSDILFSFELNKNNDKLIYSNSFLSKTFEYNRTIKSACREIVKTLSLEN